MNDQTNVPPLSQFPVSERGSNCETPAADTPTADATASAGPRRATATRTARFYAKQKAKQEAKQKAKQEAKQKAQAAAFFKGPATVFEDFATARQEGIAYHIAVAAAADQWVQRDPESTWPDFDTARRAGFEWLEAFEIAARQSLRMGNPTWHIWQRVRDEARWQLLAATRHYVLADTLRKGEAEYLYEFRITYGQSEVIVRSASVDPNAGLAHDDLASTVTQAALSEPAAAPAAAPCSPLAPPMKQRQFERFAESSGHIANLDAKVDKIAERHGFVRVRVRMRNPRVQFAYRFVHKDGRKATKEENERLSADLKKLTETGSVDGVDGVDDAPPAAALAPGSPPPQILTRALNEFAFVENRNKFIRMTAELQPIIGEINFTTWIPTWCILARLTGEPQSQPQSQPQPQPQSQSQPRYVIIALATTRAGCDAAATLLRWAHKNMPSTAAKLYGLTKNDLAELVEVRWTAEVEAAAVFLGDDENGTMAFAVPASQQAPAATQSGTTGRDTRRKYARINYALLARRRDESEQPALGFTSRGKPVSIDLNITPKRSKPFAWCVLANIDDPPQGKFVIVAKATTSNAANAALSHLVRLYSNPKTAVTISKLNGVDRAELRDLVMLPWNANIKAVAMATYPARVEQRPEAAVNAVSTVNTQGTT